MTERNLRLIIPMKGDLVILRVSNEHYAGGESNLPSRFKAVFYGHNKFSDAYPEDPSFIARAKEGLKIYLLPFGEDDITRLENLEYVVRPWPDIFPVEMNSFLPISGGDDYKEMDEMLRRHWM